MDAWLPKSVLCLQDYTPRLFMADLLAGITVGLVALPLAMAFAIASGMPPQAGLYCAIVAGFVISALGGSSTQIGGPTGAFVVVVFGIVSRFGIDGLFMCTLLKAETTPQSHCYGWGKQKRPGSRFSPSRFRCTKLNTIVPWSAA